jgi:competence protein ComEA
MFRHLIAAVLAAFALNAWAAVDINRASRAELETVKGIGPGLSAKIMKAREAGEFKSWADMVERVPGVGAASAGKLSKAGLTVAGSPFDASTMPAAAPKSKKAGKGEATAPGAAGEEAAAKPARKPAKKDRSEKAPS